MQGLVLQPDACGFLMLLWLFIWSVLRILRTDIYAPTGAVMVRRGLTFRGALLPSRQRPRYRPLPRRYRRSTGRCAHHAEWPARADRTRRRFDPGADDDYASTRHARLSQRGSEWYVEDLGSNQRHIPRQGKGDNGDTSSY